MKQINVTIPKININVPKVNIPDVKEMSAKAKANLKKIPTVDLSKLKVSVAEIPSIKNALANAGNEVLKIFNTRNKREALLEEAQKVLDVLPVSDEFKDIPVLISMLSDYNQGLYKGVRKWAIAVAFGALLYKKIPIDLIPDSIPGLGLLDDTTILKIACIFLTDDIRNYKKWQKTNHMMVYA